MPNESYCIYEVDRERGVVTITFNKPEKLNSATLADIAEIRQRTIEAGEDPDVKVVVYKGAGRGFGSGGSVGEIVATHTAEPGKRPQGQGVRITGVRNGGYGRRGFEQTILYCPKVTVAQVHGYCYGSHFKIAICCDIAVASEDAIFIHPGYRYIGPMGEDMLCLMHKIGLTKLKEMMFTGRAFHAEEAVQCGLINKVVPRDKLEEETSKMVELLTLQASDSLAIGKANFAAALAIAGSHAMASAGTIAHVWQHMMRSEPGEYNMVRTARAGGTKATLRAREERWQESPIVKP